MPRDRASALAAVICALPARKPATSHRLPCLRDVVQGHCQHHHRSAAQPAFWPLSLLTADMQVGNQMIQGKQKQHAEPNPANAGKKANRPNFSDCSIAGISRLQTDAATITPAAKPASERCTRSPRARRIKIRMLRPAMYPKGDQNPPKSFRQGYPPPIVMAS